VRIRSLQLFILAGTGIRNRGHRFFFTPPSGRQGRQDLSVFKVDWILDFLGNLDAIPSCTNSLIDIQASSSRSDKTLTFSDGAMKE